MKTIWKGAISFGLINVPIKMLSATKKNNIRFRTLHSKCKTPLKQKRYCPNCDEKVSWDDTVKGYEFEKNQYVVLTDEDFDNIPVKSTRSIDIIDFVRLQEVDPIYYIKTYYLKPGEGAEKPYLILRNAMQNTDMVAVTKVTLRQKENLALIRVMDNVLALETMFFPEEVRSVSKLNLDKLEQNFQITDSEMDMAVELVNNLSAEFNPDKYTDQYREELLKIIRRKTENQDYTVPEKAPSEDKVVNLMDKLQESVEAARKEKKSV